MTGRTANDSRPISDYTVNQLFAGLSATLGRLRVNRQLEEALNHGPDPQHLAAVFGISRHGHALFRSTRHILLSADEAEA